MSPVTQYMSSNQRFEKSVACPTNESLLGFLQTDRGELSEEELRIVEHVTSCEFCELSLELLRTYPAQFMHDPLPTPPVPEHLLQIFSTRRVHN